MRVAGVLLDLDGTLVDTAPDLVAVLNRVMLEQARRPVPYAVARNEVSNGAIALLRLGLGLAPSEDVNEEVRRRFLDLYLGNICNNSRLFIELSYLSRLTSTYGLRWGIVTNKPAYLTGPLLDRLGIASAFECVVAGDTLPQRKPHPAPLEFAAESLGLDPECCIYIGDAERDIEAGRAAGMRTVAAAYGYITAADDPRHWEADALLAHPRDLAGILEVMNTSDSIA